MSVSSIDLLRQSIRQQRRLISPMAQQRASHRLARQIIRHTSYQSSQHIACYLATNGEISLLPVIKRAWSQGKCCYLPVIVGERLTFMRYLPTSSLVSNRFGILEPEGGQLIKSADIDLVLMPLVAFDRRHNRIGMGGGFYDKTFAQHLQTKGLRCDRTRLIGVGHRLQQVGHIDARPWDVPLDGVLYG